MLYPGRRRSTYGSFVLHRLQEVGTEHTAMKNSWIAGSTDFKLSNMLNHAKSDVYKAAMTRMQADGVRLRGECILWAAACLHYIKPHITSWNWNLIFVMAKQNLLFSTYSALLELEAHHEADLGFAYRTLDLAKAFTNCIARSQQQAFLNVLSTSGTHFLWFRWDYCQKV